MQTSILHYHFWLVVIFILLSVKNLVAQRAAERWMGINPLNAEISPREDETTVLLPSAHVWGEFGPYRLQRDNDHAWSVKVGGFVELFRIGRTQSLAFIVATDLIADPHNEIRFNPRAVFWEEGFLYTIRSNEQLDYQIGYYHRCKHDIDNLLPSPSYPFESVQRALMYGSVLGKVLMKWQPPIEKSVGLFVLRADLYTILQDDRLPKRLYGERINLDQAIGSFGFNTHLRFPLVESWLGGYSTVYGLLTLYGAEPGFGRRFRSVENSLFTGGIAAGVALQGNIHLRIGISYEYLSDTDINAVPSDAHLILLGVTILHPQVMW
jgi:hypothetical protein